MGRFFLATLHWKRNKRYFECGISKIVKLSKKSSE